MRTFTELQIKEIAKQELNVKLSKTDKARLKDVLNMFSHKHISTLIRSDCTGKITKALLELGLIDQECKPTFEDWNGQ